MKVEMGWLADSVRDDSVRQEEIIERTEGGDARLEDGCSRVQSGDNMTKDQSAGESSRGKSSASDKCGNQTEGTEQQMIKIQQTVKTKQESSGSESCSYLF